MIPDGYTDLAPGKIASVVTYLEMTERPLQARDAQSKVRLRQVGNPSLDWYRSIYLRAGAQWLWFSRMEMNEAQLSAKLNSSATELLVAENAAVDASSAEDGSRSHSNEIGLAELDRAHPPEVEIASFALFTEGIGKGWGASFMVEVLTRAWAGETERVWLHTCTLDGPTALNFYMKHGFRPYKRAIEVADDPRLSGILPRTAAPQFPIIR